MKQTMSVQTLTIIFLLLLFSTAFGQSVRPTAVQDTTTVLQVDTLKLDYEQRFHNKYEKNSEEINNIYDIPATTENVTIMLILLLAASIITVLIL